jgi:hypothetical protein
MVMERFGMGVGIFITFPDFAGLDDLVCGAERFAIVMKMPIRAPLECPTLATIKLSRRWGTRFGEK